MSFELTLTPFGWASTLRNPAESPDAGDQADASGHQPLRLDAQLNVQVDLRRTDQEPGSIGRVQPFGLDGTLVQALPDDLDGTARHAS